MPLLYDLSHRLNSFTSVYPGKDAPVFAPSGTIEKDGYRETHFEFESHLGTHIDAPAHMLPNGKFLDQLPLSAFTGVAVVVDIPLNNRFIESLHLKSHENIIAKAEFILFRTGWHKFWGSDSYFRNFPVLTPEAVSFLVNHNLKGIGFDVISADPVYSSEFENHKVILGKGLIIIENLNFPENLSVATGIFSCFPLPYDHADGSPVRAVLHG